MFNHIWNLTFEGNYLLIYSWNIPVIRVPLSTHLYILSIEYTRSVLFSVYNKNCRHSTVTILYIIILYRCTHVFLLFCVWLFCMRSKIKRCIFIGKRVSKEVSEEAPIQRTSKTVCVPVFILATNRFLINSFSLNFAPVN